jgi:2-C-methyl-D-erythritol 4-phosphate cytidylyltransferase
VKVGVVLTAGGSGARFGSPVPKQFLEIRPGRPLFRYALETLHGFPGVEAVALTLPPERVVDWVPLVAEFPKLRVVAGGPERWLSVKNGVDALPGSVDTVLIHEIPPRWPRCRTISPSWRRRTMRSPASPPA